MARPLFGHSAAETGAEADPGDQAVGRASSNTQPSLFQHTTGPPHKLKILVAASSFALFFFFNHLLWNTQFITKNLFSFCLYIVPNPAWVTVMCSPSKIGRWMLKQNPDRTSGCLASQRLDALTTLALILCFVFSPSRSSSRSPLFSLLCVCVHVPARDGSR